MPFFEARSVSKARSDGSWLFKDINVSLNKGDIVALTGPSGVGKTTFLKCIAELILYEGGKSYLQDKSADEYGIPSWRSRVMYVPQRPPVMEGTPLEFFETVKNFASQSKRREFGSPCLICTCEIPIVYAHTIYVFFEVEIGIGWELSPDLWEQTWNTLSGGEMQRIAIAIAVALNPDVLLLDEPTSALDPDTSILVERTLQKHTCLWITHNPEQEKRVASQHLILGPHGEHHLNGNGNHRSGGAGSVRG
ncbi:P-loop containing nucleoside triphosphate hydrolase protein [Jimgerdemannia flammicorona]|uniref:P-loop containing nucleoside triphosphate hydrolase protein n=1 Tax=Jimgerdemannia flammicorona TaxID=994334 RepID=A0A433D8M8_9FUNG|nr:P-loop containing nucleoside triphosphate hydrolase protein [Jimgerdemannia flammicorona]